MSTSRPNYGIDAPDVQRRFLILGLVGLGVGAASFIALSRSHLPWLRFIVFPAFWCGAIFLLSAVVMLWGSKRGKLLLRDKLIRSIPWRGDESVLDVGCGHGLLLIAAARHLTTGKAIGIDLWRTEDQAGNSRDATWHNVELENVADKVELQDADARHLPFPPNSFDVILSSWALHNIYDKRGRDAAVREIIRVLKPAGRLVIVDIRHTHEYAEVLQENGMQDIKRTGPNFFFVIPTHTLTATKPATDKALSEGDDPDRLPCAPAQQHAEGRRNDRD